MNSLGDLMTHAPTELRRRILVVEDNWLDAMLAQFTLETQDCEVVGPFGTVSDATASASNSELEGAILDVNLGDETSLALVRILQRRNIPFAFATGYNAARLPDGFQSGAHLGKPYSAEMVARFLAGISLERK